MHTQKITDKDAKALLLKSIVNLTDTEFSGSITISDIAAEEISFTVNKLIFEVEKREFEWVSQPNSGSEKLPAIDKSSFSKSISEWDLSESLWNSKVKKGGYILLDKYKLSIICSHCNGDGSTKCRDCGGDPIRRCYACEGHGRHICYSCDGGRTRQRCSLCYGTGQLAIGFDKPQRYTNCSRCYGSGFLSCSSCGDQRMVSCSKCYGKGQIICSSCNGRDRVTCSECKGHRSILKTLKLTSNLDTTSVVVGGKPNFTDSSLKDFITKFEDSIKEVSDTQSHTLESLRQNSSVWPLLDKSLITNLENNEYRHTISGNQELFRLIKIQFNFSSMENPEQISDILIMNKDGVVLQHDNNLKNQWSLGLIIKMLNIINSEYAIKYGTTMNKTEFTNDYLKYIRSKINAAGVLKKEINLFEIIRDGDSSWKRNQFNSKSFFRLIFVFFAGYVATQISSESDLLLYIQLAVVMFFTFVYTVTIIRKNDNEIGDVIKKLDLDHRFSDIYNLLNKG